MRFALALALASAALVCAPAAAAALPGCDAFLDKLRDEASDLGIEFRHALIVSRARSENSVFDITTRGEVDGALTCHGDKLLRFEAHVSEPATARALSAFAKMETSSLRAALGWDAAKAKSTVDEMSADAKEYLRRIEGARRRLHRRQDRGACSRRHGPRPHLLRGRPRLHHRGPQRHEPGMTDSVSTTSNAGASTRR